MLVRSIAALVIGGCGGTVPCTSSATCPEAHGCEPSGRCRALAEENAFGRSTWLAPVDWAVTRSDAATHLIAPTDRLELGGPHRATIYLAFAPLPRNRITRAVLRLSPHESWSGPSSDVTIATRFTQRFHGARLTHTTTPPLRTLPLSIRHVRPGGARVLLIDVTSAIRAAQRIGDTRVHLEIAAVDSMERSWTFVSPLVPAPTERPRLEMVLR